MNFAVNDLALLSRDGCVTVTTAMHPPWPPLLKGGKLCATHAGGNHRSLDRKFSTPILALPELR